LRDWMPAPLVLAAYWEVDWFQPAARLRDLEQSWLTWDHAVLYGYGFRSAVESLGRLIPSILEISYVLVYAVPPLCIAAFYVWGHRERVDRFLFTFLLGTLLAYALLPHFPSASPRLEFPGQDLPTILTVWRKFNIWILNFGDIHTSVFPSGHVTAGFSAAFAMMRTLPEKKWLGRGLLIHAALVTLATIYGRYHYVADCLAGITLSLVACAGSIALTRVPAARMARSWRAAAAALLVGIFCALTARAGSIPLQRSTVAAQVRLQTHVSSYASKPGDVIRAVVLAPVKERDDVILPRGSVLLGRILKVVSVGRGLIHERASIDLEFNQWLQPDGSAKAIKTQLMSIDNAREQVSPTGRVKGILAAGGAPGFLLGMWSRPDSALFMRTAGGFAGVSHFLCERTTFAPVAVAGIIAARFYAVPLPEPEIHLPPGTELFLSISRLPVAGPFEKEPEAEAPPEALLQLAANVPIRTTRGSSQRLGDITNVMFVGSEDQLNAAFSAAGWSPSELLTPRSAVRVYKAMSAQHGYPTAPMSTMLLEGLTPDHMFQKSFNTMSKRHHLRIWERPESLGGNKVWLGAATHDTGIRFRDGGKTFTHGIDPQIDRERLKVIDDLTFAGCMEKVQLVERPHVSTAGGPAISTDGRLAVITLRDCNANSFEPLGDAPARERNATGRFMRRLVLEGRYAILRGNIYYWGYRFARRTLNRTPAISAPEPVVFDEAALTTTTGLAAASTLQ
ncbi:MAG TPA: LssY C-terminal domain-containing protein, partial [Bryobacteraceae bacterium]|nr:LssY C-terminal domain-containing protein [Bryobacteraceae bacterium]